MAVIISSQNHKGSVWYNSGNIYGDVRAAKLSDMARYTRYALRMYPLRTIDTKKNEGAVGFGLGYFLLRNMRWVWRSMCVDISKDWMARSSLKLEQLARIRKKNTTLGAFSGVCRRFMLLL